MKMIVEESAAVPLVNMSLIFRSGGALDPIGKEGLARLTARALRRGGSNMTSTQIEESIDRLGGEFSSEVSFGWTILGATVLARHAEAMADLMGRIIAEPSFDEGEFSKLRREVEAELIESRENDQILASRALRREALTKHPYSRRLGGYLPTLRSLTPEDAKSHHQRVFCKENAMLVFSGDVSKKRAKGLSEAILQQLPDGDTIVDSVKDPERRAGRHLVFVDKPDRTQMQMYLGTLGAHPRDEDLVPLQVATTALGGTFTARMMQEVRVQRGWSYGAYARLGLDRHREMFTMWAAPATADASECLKLLLEMLDRWHTDGLEKEELSFMKRYLRRSYVFDIDTAPKRAQQHLTTDLYDLPSGYYKNYPTLIKEVTLRQANKAIQERIDPQDLVIAVVGSHEAMGATIEAVIPGLTSKTVVPYDLELPPDATPEPTPASGESRDPAAPLAPSICKSRCAQTLACIPRRWSRTASASGNSKALS